MPPAEGAEAVETAWEPRPPLNEDDMVSFDYILHVDGKMRETSMKGMAEQNKLYRPDRTYGPMLVTIGIGQVIPGVEVALREKALDELGSAKPFSIVVPPDQGFGLRNRDLIRNIPLSKFGKQAIEVGTRVIVDNREGTVTRIGGGRVTVDLHHDFAGKELHYDLWVRGVYRDPQAKTEAILRRALGENVRPEWSETEAAGYGLVPAVTIRTPDVVVRNPEWAQGRGKIAEQVRFAFQGKPVHITFVESYPPALPGPPVRVDTDGPDPPSPPEAA